MYVCVRVYIECVCNGLNPNDNNPDKSRSSKRHFYTPSPRIRFNTSYHYVGSYLCRPGSGVGQATHISQLSPSEPPLKRQYMV